MSDRSGAGGSAGAGDTGEPWCMIRVRWGAIDERHAIRESIVTIGRTKGATLCFEHDSLAPQMVGIQRTPEGRAELTDFGCLGGTYVNGRRVSSCLLVTGDVIHWTFRGTGQLELVYEGAGKEEMAPSGSGGWLREFWRRLWSRRGHHAAAMSPASAPKNEAGSSAAPAAEGHRASAPAVVATLGAIAAVLEAHAAAGEMAHGRHRFPGGVVVKTEKTGGAFEVWHFQSGVVARRSSSCLGSSIEVTHPSGMRFSVVSGSPWPPPVDEVHTALRRRGLPFEGERVFPLPRETVLELVVDERGWTGCWRARTGAEAP